MTLTSNSQEVRYRYLVGPFICYLPLAGSLSLWAWGEATIPAIVKPGCLVAGVLVWTLIEYLLHRFLLHYRPQAPGLLAVVEKLHLGHHRDPQDEAKITVPVYGSLPIAAALLGLFRILAGSWEVAALLMTGSIVGYLFYEAVHFWIHRGGRRDGWFGQRRAHHLFHHFKDQTRCLGVSTPLWDLVMGTHRVKS